MPVFLFEPRADKNFEKKKKRSEGGVITASCFSRTEERGTSPERHALFSRGLAPKEPREELPDSNTSTPTPPPFFISFKTPKLLLQAGKSVKK